MTNAGCLVKWAVAVSLFQCILSESVPPDFAELDHLSNYLMANELMAAKSFNFFGSDGPDMPNALTDVQIELFFQFFKTLLSPPVDKQRLDQLVDEWDLDIKRRMAAASQHPNSTVNSLTVNRLGLPSPSHLMGRFLNKLNPLLMIRDLVLLESPLRGLYRLWVDTPWGRTIDMVADILGFPIDEKLHEIDKRMNIRGRLFSFLPRIVPKVGIPKFGIPNLPIIGNPLNSRIGQDLLKGPFRKRTAKKAPKKRRFPFG